MSLREKTIKGLTWSTVSQVNKLISQFIVTAILARLLSPNDFGTVAMITVFTNFAVIFGEMGISSALIQKQDAQDRHYCSAFWLNIFVGLILTLSFIIVSPLIALFYKKPEMVSLISVVSLNFLFSSFTIIQQTILTKEMDFKSLAIRDIVAVILAGAVGIFMAYHGFGVWSLVFQMLTFTVVNAFLLWILSAWRPKFQFDRNNINDIFSFSANITGFQIVNYFARNIDQLLIGIFLGSQALGYYSLAYKLMLMPLQNISWTISRVMFPAFSKIQGDLAKVRINYLKLMKTVSLISFPLMIALFSLAPEMVRVFWGEKWQSVIVLIRIFCLCGMAQSLGTNIGNILLSQGKASLQFKLQIFGTVIVVLSVLLGLHWGIVGVAICYTVQSIIWVHFTFYISNHLIKLSYVNLYRSLYKSYLIAVVMLIFGLMLKYFFVLADIQWLIAMPMFYVLILFVLLIILKEIKFDNGRFSVRLMQ